jgi:hypothetical protein
MKRRIPAIQIADVVGYTRLSRINEEVRALTGRPGAGTLAITRVLECWLA